MLLRNESKVKHSIDIKLVFDDNTCRELEIHEGEFVKVSYRRNGCVKHGMGIIREIKPYVTKFRCPCGANAIIVLDMSENNNAHVEAIKLDDIIDIEFAQPNCNCSELKPSTDETCCGGCNCHCFKEPPKVEEPVTCMCKGKVQFSCLECSDNEVITNG